MTETTAQQLTVGDQVKDTLTGEMGYVIRVMGSDVFVSPQRWEFGKRQTAATLEKVPLPSNTRPVELDSYLAMRITQRSQVVCVLIWCGDRWMQQAECEAHGFRAALKLPNQDAWKLQEAMLESRFFGDFMHGVSDLELVVRRLSDRQIYVFYDWDAEEGATVILDVIRADGFYAARRWFETNRADKFQTELQVRHIGGCQADWDAIAQKDLTVDLIASHE